MTTDLTRHRVVAHERVVATSTEALRETVVACVESSRQRVTLSRELLRVLREPPRRRGDTIASVECLRFEISTQVVALHSAFGRKSEADGTPCTMRGNWARLFAQMDEDRSGRLDYDEFRKAVAALGVEVAVSDLDALWAYVEADGSGEATIKEFQDATYLLMIDGWPVLDKQEKRALVFELNRLVETRHERKAFYDTEGAPTNDSAPEQRFNWFKMFNILDVDGSGRLGFEELESVIRAPYPCLCTPEEVLPLEQIKALWKAIDADSSGDVTVDEFMGFMRSYGPTLAEVAAMKRDAMLKKRAKERTRRFGTADEKQALGEARSPARRGFSPARARRWAAAPRKRAPSYLSSVTIQSARPAVLAAELAKRRAPVFCGAADPEGRVPLEALLRNGPCCVAKFSDVCVPPRLTEYDVAVWQHLGHLVLEFAATGKNEEGASYACLAADVSAAEVARACMRRADAAKLYRGLCESAVCDADGALALDARRGAAAAAGGAHRRRRGPPKANYYYRLGEIGGELWHDWIANTWWRVAPPLWHARHVEVALSSGGRAVLDCTTRAVVDYNGAPSLELRLRLVELLDGAAAEGVSQLSLADGPSVRTSANMVSVAGGVYARVHASLSAPLLAPWAAAAPAPPPPDDAAPAPAPPEAPAPVGAPPRAAAGAAAHAACLALVRALRIDVAPRRSAAPRPPAAPRSAAADPAAAHWTLSAALPDELEARAAALTAASLPLIVKTQARVRLRSAATLVRAMLAARAVVRSWCAGLLRDARALRWRRAALRAYRRHKAAAKIGHACRRLLKKRREAADFAVTGRRHHVDFALTAAAAGGGARLAAQGGVRLGRVGRRVVPGARPGRKDKVYLAKSKPTL